MSNPVIQIGATVSSTLEKVWQFYTEAAHVVNWNHASDDWYTPSAENDLKTGGYFAYKMSAKDGSFSFNFSGIYNLIEPLKTIVYTLDDGRKVTVAFSETAEGVVIDQAFEAETVHDLDLQQQGWQAILDNFKLYAETH
jgi:uncharacterized protein YndB with AHSA1/START domain